MLSWKWINHVSDVQRISDRIILLRLGIGKKVFTFVSVYAPQVVLSATVKDKLYELLQSHMAKIPASEEVILLGDWNGHVGAKSEGFSDVHGGMVLVHRTLRVNSCW